MIIIIMIIMISNEEMDDILKVIKSLEESGLLTKGISETIKKEAKKIKHGFLGMLLGKCMVLVY